MSKATPGPWVFGAVIMTKDEVPIAQIIDNPQWPNGEVEANARLIAAAPDLLRELNLLVELVPPRYQRSMERVRVLLRSLGKIA